MKTSFRVVASGGLVAAGLARWVPMTMGMAALGWHESLSLRVLTLDSIVNLVAVGAASLGCERSQRVQAAVWSALGGQRRPGR